MSQIKINFDQISYQAGSHLKGTIKLSDDLGDDSSELKLHYSIIGRMVTGSSIYSGAALNSLPIPYEEDFVFFQHDFPSYSKSKDLNSEEFSFSLYLPPDLPATFEFENDPSHFAKVEYLVTATLKKHENNRNKIASNEEKIFIIKKDLTQEISHAEYTGAQALNKYFCFSAGAVGLKARIDKTKYNPGDDLIVFVKIDASQAKDQIKKILIKPRIKINYMVKGTKIEFEVECKQTKYEIKLEEEDALKSGPYNKEFVLKASLIPKESLNYKRLVSMNYKLINCSYVCQVAVENKKSFKLWGPTEFFGVPLSIGDIQYYHEETKADSIMIARFKKDNDMIGVRSTDKSHFERDTSADSKSKDMIEISTPELFNLERSNNDRVVELKNLGFKKFNRVRAGSMERPLIENEET